MRLNKYIAAAGVVSRRKADELTLNGNVRINGAVMRVPGYDVREGDEVTVNGRRVRPADRRVYLILHKPKGFVTSAADERERPTVMDLIGDVEERVFPVGRLDMDSSGLLILTNDGEAAQRMNHPKHEIYKTYRAQVAGVLSDERLAALRRGVDIGGFVTAPAEVRVIKQSERSAAVEIKIREGKNRQVRRMFAAVGNKVTALERVAVGELVLGRLKEGHYRKMTPPEIAYMRGEADRG